MPPAVAAAGIAAATIGGAVLSSGAQKSAANAATQAQNGATAAQLQLGRDSLGLQRDVYNSNYQTLSPFVSNGLVASNAMNALLGLPAAQPMTSPLAQQPGPTAPGANPANPANPANLNPSTALQAIGAYYANR